MFRCCTSQLRLFSLPPTHTPTITQARAAFNASPDTLVSALSLGRRSNFPRGPVSIGEPRIVVRTSAGLSATAFGMSPYDTHSKIKDLFWYIEKGNEGIAGFIENGQQSPGAKSWNVLNKFTCVVGIAQKMPKVRVQLAHFGFCVGARVCVKRVRTARCRKMFADPPPPLQNIAHRERRECVQIQHIVRPKMGLRFRRDSRGHGRLGYCCLDMGLCEHIYV